jgi:hypothetical protein
VPFLGVSNETIRERNNVRGYGGFGRRDAEPRRSLPPRRRPLRPPASILLRPADVRAGLRSATLSATLRTTLLDLVWSAILWAPRPLRSRRWQAWWPVPWPSRLLGTDLQMGQAFKLTGFAGQVGNLPHVISFDSDGRRSPRARQTRTWRMLDYRGFDRRLGFR